MHIRSLKGKRICILGFGREGQATLRALQHYAPDAAIFIADTNAQQENSEYPFITGPKYLESIDKQHFHTIIKSPGIPPHPLFEKWRKEDRLTSATQIFFDSIAESGTTVIGVTGSKGKSTTASLIFAILNSQFSIFNLKTAFLIGNIGEPALNHLRDANEKAVFVMELSSYQLMDLTVSPHIAIITSLFPEHLDYHGSLEAYKEAKCHIVKFQTEDDIVFYSSETPPPHPSLSPREGERVEQAHASEGEGAYTIAMLSHGKKVPFSEEDAPLPLEQTKLIGQHNLRNIAGAWKVAEHLGIPHDVAVGAIKKFRPLLHRLQSLGIYNGIEWMDDAISTTPESTIAALDALGNRVTTIILGGLDRGYDFTKLAERIAHSSIQIVILLVPSNVEAFPGSSHRIRAALDVTSTHLKFFEAGSMEEAVRITKKETNLSPHFAKATRGKPNTYNLTPICLLSTASPSYNMFKNFEEKGDCFRKAIQSL